jgi:drug/metabolite transporter (DMT)-like permease
MEFSRFRFPITMSFIHMAISTLLSFTGSMIFGYRQDTDKQIEMHDQPGYEKTVMTRIVYLSVLFSMNIIFGNNSLKHCSVAFVQIVRAIIPMLTMIMSVVFLRSKFTIFHYVSCLVVCVGVVFSCFGEINLTVVGFVVTVIGCVLSAAKSVSVKMSLTGAYELHSSDLLERMSPVAAIEMFMLVVWTGENTEMIGRREYQPTFSKIMGVLVTGVIAHFLNLTNFLATFHTSPLTVTIVGCVKQVVTIVLSVIIFDKKLTMLNTFGVIVTTCGSLWYGLLKFKKKGPRDPAALEEKPGPAAMP